MLMIKVINHFKWISRLFWCIPYGFEEVFYFNYLDEDKCKPCYNTCSTHQHNSSMENDPHLTFDHVWLLGYLFDVARHKYPNRRKQHITQNLKKGFLKYWIKAMWIGLSFCHICAQIKKEKSKINIYKKYHHDSVNSKIFPQCRCCCWYRLNPREVNLWT